MELSEIRRKIERLKEQLGSTLKPFFDITWHELAHAYLDTQKSALRMKLKERLKPTGDGMGFC